MESVNAELERVRALILNLERGIADIETTVILKDKAVNDLLAEKGQWGEDTSEYRRLQERYELAKEEKRMLQQEKHDLRAELTSRIQEKTALVQNETALVQREIREIRRAKQCSTFMKGGALQYKKVN